MLDPNNPEHLKKVAEAINKMKESIAKAVDHAILFGDALENAKEPIGIFNCRCEIVLNDERMWLLFLSETMDETFGDTDPSTPDFRDLE